MIINILTFSKVYNRGANMQAYALKKYLEDRGAKVEFLDLQLPISKEMNWRGRLFEYFQNQVANRFRKHMHFCFTRKYKNLSDLKNDPPKADVYVVGSDQVWNPSLTQKMGALTYFFDFLPLQAKRVSYAASIGDAIWKYGELSPCIKEELKKFAAISVRENSAREICKRNFETDAEVVLDPTLLLTHSDLKDIIGLNRSVLKSQTFVYLLYNGSDTFSITRLLHKLSGNKKIKGLSYSIFAKITRFYSIENWLKQIDSSSLIITNSFHCMVMALLLHKEFIVIPPYPGRETRMLSLLSKIGLVNRYVNSIEDITKLKELVERKIDYIKVEDNLKVLRKKSEDFINNNIF